MELKRNAEMLRAYNKIVTGQLLNDGTYLTKKDCQDLFGLISVLEEENKQLKEAADQVSEDLHTVIKGDKSKEDDYVNDLMKIITELEDNKEFLESVPGKTHAEVVKNVLAKIPEKYSDRRIESSFIISHWIQERFNI